MRDHRSPELGILLQANQFLVQGALRYIEKTLGNIHAMALVHAASFTKAQALPVPLPLVCVFWAIQGFFVVWMLDEV
jgi:hypothetical protein